MIVFIPKIIETEQEASELPEGTVVFFDLNGEIISGSKAGIDYWRTTDYGYYGLDSEVVGWTSLREVDVVDSLASVVAERSEFHSVDEVRRRLKERNENL